MSLNVKLTLVATNLDGSSHSCLEHTWSNVPVEGLMSIQTGLLQLGIDLVNARPALVAATGTGVAASLGDGYPKSNPVAAS